MMNKHVFTLLLLAFFVTGAVAQDYPVKVAAPPGEINYETTIFDSRELQVKPEYPGGMAAFYKFISGTLKVPDIISETDITLRMFVTFVVEKDGAITDIKVLRDPGYGLGEEAQRVFRLSEKWKPGMQNGKLVRTSFNVPITLQIEGVGKTEEQLLKE